MKVREVRQFVEHGPNVRFVDVGVLAVELFGGAQPDNILGES